MINMKCPKCNDDMTKGFLSCWAFTLLPKNIFWYKKPIIEQGMYVGDKEKTSFGKDFEAFICKNCKMVIFNY